MATDIEYDIDIDIDREFDTDALVVREPRVPNAVWINRPAAAERGAVHPASAILGAVGVAALLVIGAMLTRDEASVSPVSPARADVAAEPTGNGPTGYFPDGFPRVTGEIEPLPPTF